MAQYGGDKINEADKNRLSEEINILYVAATRAKNKLIIPPEINPLRSIEMSQQQQTTTLIGKNYQRSSYLDDLDLYSYNTAHKEYKNNPFKKPGNYGKR